MGVLQEHIMHHLNKVCGGLPTVTRETLSWLRGLSDFGLGEMDEIRKAGLHS